MKRTLAKIGFVFVLWALVVAICIEIDQTFDNFWTGGLGGGFGAVVVLTVPKLFDRMWPKRGRGLVE